MTDIGPISAAVRNISAQTESGILPLLIALALLLLTAKLAGALAVKIGQPAVFGELLAGLILGPSVLNVFHFSLFADPAGVTADTILQLGQLGVIFLMFSAGLETELSELRQSGRPAIGAGILGVILPIVMAGLITLPFVADLKQAVFLGIVLAATSVSISAQTLLELGRLRTREGMTLLGAAVVDDVIVILTLSVFLGVTGGEGEMAVTILRLVLVLAVAAVAGYYLMPLLADAASRLPVSQGLLALVIAAALIFAWGSEFLGGMAAITGAYLAGVGLSRTRWRDEIRQPLQAMNYAFFVPIYLVGVGLQADVRHLDSGSLILALVLILTAALSKYAGSGLGARLGGMSTREAQRVGVGMISRGEVGLIVAGVGLSLGLLDGRLYTLIVVTVLATTLITPPLLRRAFR